MSCRMTTTVESIFGTGRMVDGFFLNNQLTDFSFSPIDDQGRPVANAVAAGKRPRSSMTPAILLTSDGKFAGAIGSAGGNAIIAYVAKNLVASIDWNEPMAKALAEPNLVARGPNFQGEVTVFSPQVLEGLRQRGIDLKPGQGEDSGVTARPDPQRQDRRRRRPAPRRRGADDPALARGADQLGDVGEPLALQALGQAARDPPGDARPFVDHRGVELDQARAGANALPRVIRVRDPADADQRHLAAGRGAEFAQRVPAPAPSAARPRVRPASPAISRLEAPAAKPSCSKR